jgi:hypothetical protein
MASFPQASPPTSCALLYPSPYAPHAQPISFVSILPPAQYWVRGTEDLPATFSKYLISFDFIAIVIICEKFIFLRHSPYNIILSSYVLRALFSNALNPLNAELNLICHLLALLGVHPILHVSMIRVNVWPSLRLKSQFSHPYKSGTSIGLHIFVVIFGDRRRNHFEMKSDKLSLR